MSDHRNHGRCPVIDHEGAEIEGTESIWSNGVCNVDLVQHTLTSQISPRIELLSEQFEQAKTSDGISDFLQDVEQAPQPPRLVGKQSAIRSAVLPLVSDVWNGMEPMNYVGSLKTTDSVILEANFCTACRDSGGISTNYLQGRTGQWLLTIVATIDDEH
jgi:hypothetical protein